MGSLHAITPFTLLDYPGEVACVAWFAGCNLRCAYCHNPDIALGRGMRDENELVAFLKKRRGVLTGVVLSGGEATFCPSLPRLAREAKALGYKIKLDTNGSRPEILQALLDENLLDDVALDYKCPAKHANDLLGTAHYVRPFEESLALLIERSRQDVRLEVRTTFHADLMQEEDLAAIIGDLEQRGYRGVYAIQNIVSHGEKTLGCISRPSRDLMRDLLPQPEQFSLSFRNFPEIAIH